MNLAAEVKRLRADVALLMRKDSAAELHAELAAIGCDLGKVTTQREDETPAFAARREAKLRELDKPALGNVILFHFSRIPGKFGFHMGNVQALAHDRELAARVLPPLGGARDVATTRAGRKTPVETRKGPRAAKAPRTRPTVSRRAAPGGPKVSKVHPREGGRTR